MSFWTSPVSDKHTQPLPASVPPQGFSFSPDTGPGPPEERQLSNLPSAKLFSCRFGCSCSHCHVVSLLKREQPHLPVTPPCSPSAALMTKQKLQLLGGCPRGPPRPLVGLPVGLASIC